MKQIEFFIQDLTLESQNRFIEFLDGDNGNYDVIPFCVFEQEDKEV
jgi:hypothetical protein